MQWIAFALWLAYGLFMWHRRSVITERLQLIDKRYLLLLAIGALFFGVAILFAGLIIVQSAGGLTLPWAWPVIILCGLAFVHCQMLGAMLALGSSKSNDTSQEGDSSNYEERSNN